jgi:hypothetical protein
MRSVFTLPADLDQLLRMAVYPAMIESESRPLRAWIRKYGVNFNELRFDVRLGPGGQADETNDPATRKAWEHITRMRLDVLGWKAPNVATLIECKDTLGNDGVWQLLAYRDAYVSDHPTDEVRLQLVAAAATASAVQLAQRYGIAVSLWAFGSSAVDVAAPATENTPNGV